MSTTDSTAGAREIYPSAPLRFVAVEVRYGYAPALATAEGQAQAHAHFRDCFSLTELVERVEVAVNARGAMPSQASTELLAINEERTESIQLGPAGVAIQTALFSGADELLATFRLALEGVAAVVRPSVQRIGIRYTDEVRLPDVHDMTDWSRYIDPRLLGSIGFAGEHEIEYVESILALRTGENEHLVLRYGPRIGHAVSPDGVLRLPPPPFGMSPESHFFLLDFDSFWQGPPRQGRPFDIDDVIEVCRALDRGPHDLFEQAISQSLRERFREARPS